MILEIAIIIGSVSAALTAITLASFSYTKYIFSDTDEEKFSELKVFSSASGLLTCPFCKMTHGKSVEIIPNGSFLLETFKKEKKNIGRITLSKNVSHGASSAVYMNIKNIDYLWQACTACGGQWLLKDKNVLSK